MAQTPIDELIAGLAPIQKDTARLFTDKLRTIYIKAWTLIYYHGDDKSDEPFVIAARAEARNPMHLHIMRLPVGLIPTLEEIDEVEIPDPVRWLVNYPIDDMLEAAKAVLYGE